MGAYKNLLNKKFGRLTAIEDVGRDFTGASIWKCSCDCGKKPVVRGKSLTSGLTKSCGCLRKEVLSKKIKNISGMIFNEWVVLEKHRKIKGTTQWLCRCKKCSKEKWVNSNHLLSGRSKSCGCIKTNVFFIDLTEKIFGNVLVLHKTPSRRKSSGGIIWACKCLLCEQTFEALGSSLTSGHTKSCGCLNESYVANECKKYFIKRYDAILEYKECINPDTGRYLPYDFYIPKYNTYIEINGKQHYKRGNHFHKNNSDFEYQKYKDNVKKKHAKKHGKFIEVDIRKYDTPEKAIAYIEKDL